MRSAMQIAVASLFVGGAVLGLKLLAWRLTGSVALLSDALESIVNLATAVAALVALRVAARPADERHPYGHHKAELLSATLEGALIVLAALLIFSEAYRGYVVPRRLDMPLPGLLLNGAATAINGAWAVVLVRQGRKLRSPALDAEGKHLLTDVFTSVGVGAGVLLAYGLDWPLLDPLLAAVVGVGILWSGLRMLRSTLSKLLDEAAHDDMLHRIRALIAAHGAGAIEAHALKTRQAGRAMFVEFHLVVPGTMPVGEAHEICDRIEAALHENIPECEVLIHVEPGHMSETTGITEIPCPRAV